MEAFNLLQKSIIRVEEEDVDIEETYGTTGDDVMDSAEALRGMTINETDDQMQTDTPSGKIRIHYELFERIKLMLAHKLYQVQQNATEGEGKEKFFPLKIERYYCNNYYFLLIFFSL
jgi:DNA replication licensing factor MCM6